MNKPNASVLTEILRFCASKLVPANALLAIAAIGARGRMRLLLGLLALVSGGALAVAQTPGCVPNTANYPCVYVANEFDGNVAVVNAISNTVIARVTVGSFPQGLAVTPNNTSVYVANSGEQDVSVIDTATNAVVATVPTTNFPFQVAITPDGTHAYVTEFLGDRAKRKVPQQSATFVEVIDTATNQVVGSIAGLTSPSAVAISPNGALVYVADTCPNNACVEVVNTSNNQIVVTVQIPNALTFSEGSIGVTLDGSLVCVSVGVRNIIGEVTDLGVAFINTSTNTLAGLLDTQTTSGISDVGFALTPGGLLYAAAFSPDGVYLVNPVTESLGLPQPIQVGSGPTGAALAPNGASIYVTNANDGTGSVINIKTNSVTATLAALGYEPYGVAGMQVRPLPLINQPLVPDATPAGGSEFTLTINGTGFVSNSVVNWNGTALATTFVNGSQLTASVPASDIAADTTASIIVTNPAPGGGTSNSVFFPVTSPTASITLSKTDYGTGVMPIALTTGVFSQSGKLDLAVANYNDGTVSILLGNGDGTFQRQSVYATGSNPGWIVTGDFNGDGKLDLAVANTGANTVSILLGNGDGTFQPQMTFGVGPAPLLLTTADFNGDGKLDLAVVNSANFTVSILLGNGDGTFQPQTTFSTGVNPFAVVGGDFNRDGILDLAVADAGDGTVSILLGNGDGSFQEPRLFSAGANPFFLITADFSGDGKLALAVTNDFSNTISILLGNGDGTFQSPVAYATGGLPGFVSTGDLNGDGKLDLAVANDGDSTVSILLGNGDGTFQAQMVFPTTAGADGVVNGDFNGDGRVDLAVSNPGSNSVSVLLQSPSATVNPTSLNFGNQPVGTTSASQQVSITNTGSATLTISNISITGANSGDFALTAAFTPVQVLPGAIANFQILFTPTAIGTRNATLSITDNAPGSPQSVSLTGVGISPVVITTTTLPNGTVGFAYNQTLQATGGTSPYVWTVTTGSLPVGLSLSSAGVISGTPTTVGTSTFTVMATDAKGFSATAPLSIVIVTSQAPTITTQPASQTINPQQTATLTVVATGAPPPTYQWYEGQSGDTSILIPGATKPFYTTPPLTTNTSYWVQVSNGVSPAANSATATITINLTCTLTVQGSGAPGSSNPLSIAATVTCVDIPGESFTISVNWGDGTSNSVTNGVKAPHLYAATGTYVIVATATTTSETTTTASSPVTLVQVPQVPGVFPGQTSDVPLSLGAPGGPFAVTFECTTVTDSSGAVKQASDLGISCSSIPSPVTLPVTPPPPNQPNVTITIATTGPATGSIAPGLRRGNWLVAMWLPLAALVLFGAGWRKPGLRRSGIAPWLAGSVLAILLVLITSCSGGFTAPVVTQQATPAGNYQVTVVSQPAPGQTTTGFVQTSLIVPLPVSPTP